MSRKPPSVALWFATSLLFATPVLAQPIQSTCRLKFPPVNEVACAIATPGTQYYVNAATGSDLNAGTSPSTAWASLDRALQAAPNGSSIRVAAGTYSTASVVINRPLTVKGGFNSTFGSWNPALFQTTLTGAVNLSDSAAVLGGFRLVSRPANLGWVSSWHSVSAGSLIRNYIEVVYSDTESNHFAAIQASAPAGQTSKLLCNDIYVQGVGTTLSAGLSVRAIQFDNHAGTAEVSSNRICSDSIANYWINNGIDGSGSCNQGSTAPRITLSNNIIEMAQQDSWSRAAGVEFKGCGMDAILTNNTILSTTHGLSGSGGGSSGAVRWKLTNNIIFSEGSQWSAIYISSIEGTITSSENNLMFGFASNAPSIPPALTANDDVSGAHTVGEVFRDVPNGNFKLLPCGPGIWTGLNVYNSAAYGSLTKDLGQGNRSNVEPWHRGAYGAW